MKKLFILALCASFAACGNDNQNNEATDENTMNTEQTMEDNTGASTSSEVETEGNRQMDVDTTHNNVEESAEGDMH